MVLIRHFVFQQQHVQIHLLIKPMAHLTCKLILAYVLMDSLTLERIVMIMAKEDALRIVSQITLDSCAQILL